MALDATNLFTVAQGGANAVHLYLSTDAIASVDDADYFLGAQERLREHDVIISIDTDTNTVDVLMVSASTTSTVTVVNGT